MALHGDSVVARIEWAGSRWKLRDPDQLEIVRDPAAILSPLLLFFRDHRIPLMPRLP
jgi:hypothetical protein